VIDRPSHPPPTASRGIVKFSRSRGLPAHSVAQVVIHIVRCNHSRFQGLFRLKNGVKTSGFQFTAAQLSERAAVGEFLFSVFKDPLLTGADLLQWKYFDEREDWPGSRSYILKRGEKILAHGGVDPVTLCTPRGEVSSIHGSDWAAAPSAPGVGILLLQNVAKLADIYLVPGGTGQTRLILPEIGFQSFGERYTYSRVVRPWQHMRAERSPGWKSPLRLGRNWVRNLAPRSSTMGWSSVPLASFGDAELPLLERGPNPHSIRCRRTPSVLNYLLRCPVAAVSAFLLVRGTQPEGYYILSRVGNQVRIADLSLNSDSAADWRAGYSLAAQTAAADSTVCEVLTAVSTEVAREALASNRFRLLDRRTVLVLDRKGLLEDAPHIDLQLLDGDEFYLHSD